MIPASNDPKWTRALTGSASPANASLGTRMLLSRLRTQVMLDPGSMSKAIAELRDYFARNSAAQADLAHI